MSRKITVVKPDPTLADPRITTRADSIEYAIRDIVVPSDAIDAEFLKKRKPKLNGTVLRLNIGDPNKYDFDTPEYIKDHLLKAINKGDQGYTASTGQSQLLNAIVAREMRYNYIKLDSKKIITTHGLSEAIAMLMAAFVDSPDDVILIPGPSYPPYTNFVEFYGGTPIEYKCVESVEDGWIPDLADIKAKLAQYHTEGKGKVRGLVVINPNNPTGALIPDGLLKDIVLELKKHGDIPLISDEVYDQMVFAGKKAISPCYYANEAGVPFVLMNGMSKNYLAPGWRLGYLATNSRAIFDGCIGQARIRLCSNSIIQSAFAKTLVSGQVQDAEFKKLREKLEGRGRFIYEKLNNDVPGISCALPGGSFYAFPKIEEYPEHVKKKKAIDLIRNKYGVKIDQRDKAFVLSLLHHKHMLCVNGSAFGKTYGKDHFRIVFLPTKAQLAVFVDRLKDFMNGDIAKPPKHWLLEAKEKGYLEQYKADLDSAFEAKFKSTYYDARPRKLRVLKNPPEHVDTL